MQTSLTATRPFPARSRPADRARAVPLDRLLTGLAAVGTGVMAGFFWAFTAVVMPGLGAGETAPAAAMAAMQGINDVVRNPQFALFFFGTPLLCLLLLAQAVIRRDSAWRLVEAAAAILYLGGVLGVTFAFNVPLNDELAALDASDPATAPAMAGWIADWTAWNDVRTIAGLLAFALLAASLVAGRPRRGEEAAGGATA